MFFTGTEHGLPRFKSAVRGRNHWVTIPLQVVIKLQLTPTVRLMNDIASSKMALDVLSISSTVSLIRSLHTNVNSTPALVIKQKKEILKTAGIHRVCKIHHSTLVPR